MIGGAHDPQAVTLDDDTLLGIVRKDLRTTMGIDAEPVLARIYRHPNGIAQYTVGHQQRLDTIHQRLERLPGLWVTGSSYYGISMNACIAKAGEQAEEILQYLRHSTYVSPY
jgi:oxygen-dependent protoporphyrinogen oxidase